MNLVLHIVRKDLRRMRGWLLAWAVLHAVPILVGLYVATHDPYGIQPWRLPDRMNLFLWAQGVVGYLLALILFDEDTVLGSQRFWLTRPISGGRLLVAKAVGAMVILAVIPILISLPWWVWCGLGARAIGTASIELLVVAVAIGVPAALVATLTDSLARALLWSLVLVTVVVVGFGGFEMLNAFTTGNPDEIGVAVARQIVLIVALLVEAAAAIVLQFRLRRTGLILAMFVPLAVVTGAVTARSMWRFDTQAPQDFNPERAAAISVSFDYAVMQPLPTKSQVARARQSNRQPSSQQLESFFTPTGTPAGTLLMGIAARQTWRWPEGTSIERQWLLQSHFDSSWALGATLGLKFPGVDEGTRNWWLHELAERRQAIAEGRRPTYRPPPESAGAKYGEAPLASPDIAGGQHVTLGAVAFVPPSLAARMNREPNDYEARLWMALARPHLAFEMPLEVTGWRRDVGGKLRIAGVERHPDVATLTVVGTRLMGLWERIRSGLQARGWWDLNYSLLSRTGPVIINRQRGEIRPAGPHNAREVVIAGVDVQWMKLDAFGGTVIRNGKEVARPGWLEGATLAVLYWEPESIFERDVNVQNLRVDEYRHPKP